MPIDDGACEIKMRSNDLFLSEFSPEFVGVRRPEHFAYASHAIRDVKRISGLVVPGVHVHIPETWNQVFAPSIHDARACRRGEASAPCDIADLAVRNHYGL